MESMMNMNMMPFGGFGHHTPEFNMMPSTSMHSNFPAFWSSFPSMPSTFEPTTGFGGESPLWRMRNFPSTWNNTMPSMHHESMPFNWPMSSMHSHEMMPHHMSMNMPSMTMPSMNMPSMNMMPSMHHESMHPMHPMHPMHRMMNMTMPSMTMPSMTMPSMTMPSMTMPSMHHESMHPMHPMHPMHMMNMTMPSTMMPHFPMWSNKNEVELRNMPVRPCNWNEYHSLTHPIKFDDFGNRCFAIGFDMHSYKPEEIKVTIKGGKWIVIEATMEEKVDPKAAEMMKTPEWMTVSWLSNAKGSVKRTYTREVAIPEECKPENMKCFMTGHGWLCFECPMTTSTTCPTMPSHPMSHPYMSKMGHMMPHHDMHHFSTRHHEVTFPVTVTVKA